MRILFVAGTFDENGGRPSGLARKAMDAILNLNGVVSYHNGGTYKTLKNDLERIGEGDYDIVFWWADVPNELPKIRNIKEIAPYTMLVTSKRNDDEKYPFGALVGRALAAKANLCFEFRKQDNGIYWFRIFDPLGSSWYEGEDIDSAMAAAWNRLMFLRKITRQHTARLDTPKDLPLAWYFDSFSQDMSKADEDIPVPDETRFLRIVQNHANTFQKLMPGAQTTRMLGNASMKPLPPQVGRCSKGMPSFRADNGWAFMSARNVEKATLCIDDFVPVCLKDGQVLYCGDRKPSVDTPIQLRLYEALPGIRYMIHSHCYITGAPFTHTCVPCGAIEEVQEVLDTIKRAYSSLDQHYYIVNLIGHGSLAMAAAPEQLDSLDYYARPMPEKMFP